MFIPVNFSSFFPIFLVFTLIFPPFRYNTKTIWFPPKRRGAKEAVVQWTILRSRKRPGVLTRAVRGTGIPSAVRVRFLIEASSGLKRQQYPLRLLRLRRDSPAAADKTLHSSLFTPGCKVNNTLAHRANISHSAKRNISH